MTAYETALLHDILFGQHNGYDRVVLQFIDQGKELPPPYVDVQPKLYTDGSGQEITGLGGNRFVVIRIEPAQAHKDDGTSTLACPRRKTDLNMPRVKGYAVVGDFEGVVTVGVAVGDPNIKPMTRVLRYNTYQLVVDISYA